jgi:transcriptional regulator with PAS, ATPase and Fis domain
MEPLECFSLDDKDTDVPTSLLVNDRDGNILICNSLCSLIMGIPLKELQTMNIHELLKNGVYKISTVLKAIETKQVVIDIVEMNRNFRVLSKSTPIHDAQGNISVVISTTHLLDEDQYSISDLRTIDQFKKNEYQLLKEEDFYDGQVVAESLEMKRILQICNQVAQYDSKVLLYGASGTGKEVLSNYIHRHSQRKTGPFVSVNCAAVPDSLFESELFGHEKGAFTGAAALKQGLFEVANGGTLFLDEISEMPYELQAKLLRVLETQEFRHIGGTETYKSDFRLICATNKDLSQMVEAGTFRCDLYYRINVINIRIPPLRKRKQDVISLANQFINEFNIKYGKHYMISMEEFRYLLSHDWPGNVRELKNYIERTIVTSGIYSSDRNDNKYECLENYCIVTFNQDTDLKGFLAEAEKQYLMTVLEKCGGKIGCASNQLGIHRTVLYRKLKAYNVQDGQNM